MYNTFECHFKPNQKLQSDMTDPVMWPIITIQKASITGQQT